MSRRVRSRATAARRPPTRPLCRSCATTVRRGTRVSGRRGTRERVARHPCGSAAGVLWGRAWACGGVRGRAWAC
eukprot:737894-Prymnesium_polylepis.1